MLEQGKGEHAVAEEFIDFYEVLELPLDAERGVVRKRINELYLEAQRNLDHRTFATRVRYQEMFEMTLPQARYILLDETRRADYNRLVLSMRALKSGSSVVAPIAKPREKTDFKESGFRLSEEVGQTPPIEPLPNTPIDAAAVARERDELWRKWKSGLEQALERDGETENNPQPSPAPQTPQPRPPREATAPQSSAALDFNEKQFASSAAAEEEADVLRAQQREVEQRRANHKREVLKAMLEGVGLKGMLIGAGAVGVPGVIAMVLFMTTYYPVGQAPKIELSSSLAWVLWMIALASGAFFAARGVSKSMRRRAATELSTLSYEELMRRSKQTL